MISQVQHTETATPTQELNYTTRSTELSYLSFAQPPPAEPPDMDMACDQAATPPQQECNYAIVGATQPPNRPHQPPAADDRVQYSDITFF